MLQNHVLHHVPDVGLLRLVVLFTRQFPTRVWGKAYFESHPMSTPHPFSPRLLLLCPRALACAVLQQARGCIGKLFLDEEPGQELFIGRLGFRSPRRNLNRLRGGACCFSVECSGPQDTSLRGQPVPFWHRPPSENQKCGRSSGPGS